VGRHLVGCQFELSTIIFTPAIDRRRAFGTLPARFVTELNLLPVEAGDER
jgi:hypothetical protein